MRNRKGRLMAAAMALLAAACTPNAEQTTTPDSSAAAPSQSEVMPSPSEVMKATFTNCTWGQQTGPGLSIWAFTCPGHKLVADEALPGFQMQVDDGAGNPESYPAIQVFTKPAEATIDAVLTAVRAASPGPFTAECVFTPNANDPSGMTFMFTPTGAGKIAHEAFMAGKSGENSMPCGPMGPKEAGDRVFQAVAGAADKVVYVDLGSEIQIFDVNTLHAAK
jgi:hypothetical protein